jgi:hypothetical protein
MKSLLPRALVAAALLVAPSLSLAQAPKPIPSTAMFKAGDMNGDLKNDLIVLRSLLTFPSQVYKLTEIQFVDGRTLVPFHSISPENANLRNPRAFRLGDVDGDLRADVAIISEATSKRRADSVFLYSGGTGALIRKLPLGKGAITVLSMTRAGDVDKDGVSDFVMGTAQDRPELRSVRIFSGATGKQIARVNTKAVNPLAQTMATIADRNLDGLPDIIVGGVVTGKAKGGAFSILSGKDLKVLFSERSQNKDFFVGDDVHEGVDVTGDGVPEYVVSVLVKRVANHIMRVYNGASGSLMYGITTGDISGSSPTPGVRVNSRVMDWTSDVDFDCIPEAVVLGDDTGIRLYSGANGSFIRKIASASSFATLNGSSKPYSRYMALSGVDGQSILDVRALFYDPLRPFCGE